MEPLLTDIDAFLETHQMSPSAFGDAALGDRHLIRQLREGRRMWPETEGKVRAFMTGYPAQSAAA